MASPFVFSNDTRYHPVLWVCKGGAVTAFQADGTRTFDQIYIDRPWDCRWCVLRPACVDETYLLIDMYDTRIERDGLMRTFHIGTHYSFPTLDAAIMAAQFKPQEV